MVTAILAAIGFSALLVTLSYGVHHRLLGPGQRIQPYDLALTVTAVFLLAILGESLINPIYEWSVGRKLWEYRILPLHDGNVSALAVLIWSAYGIHLYFIQRTLDHRLPPRLRNRYGKALIIGLEAPLVWEVSGNLFFLIAAQQYYAYYNPPDIWHFTSIQVVPVYIVCILVGLLVLQSLQRLGRHWALPSALLIAGLGYLIAS